MNYRTMVKIGILILTFGFGAVTVEASTIAYWRFEEGAFLSDSGPNSLPDLTQGGSSDATVYALPGTGPGAYFSNPIPQTGQTNTSASNFGTAKTAYLQSPSNSLFNVDAFTVEAYVNHTMATTANEHQYVIGQWNTTGDQRGWALGISRSTNPVGGLQHNLFLLLSDDGASAETVSMGYALETDHDYFLAVSFDSTAGINFYVKDLESGAVTTVNVANPLSGSLFHSTAPLDIGTAVARTTHEWTGLIDELRFSDVALSSDQCLIVPEPGTISIIAMGALLYVRRLRRRQ